VTRRRAWHKDQRRTTRARPADGPLRGDEPVAYAGLQAFAASGRISATWLRRAAVGHAGVSAVCAGLSGGASGIDFVTALRAATDAYQEILQAKKRAT
jgi:hypothetical protein